MNKFKSSGAIRAMTECSIMIALSTVLSILKLAELPYGGSITVASMLPIVIAVFRHGGKWGFGTALVYSVIQMLLGLKNFSYFTTAASFITLAVLDYIVAFSVFALAGVFKKIIKRQNLAVLAGVLLASLLRYACHVISGATVWAGLSIPTEAALIYSLSYNATYMIPESVILVLCTAYITSAIDFTTSTPTRVRSESIDMRASYCYIGAGACAIGALIADVIIVFAKLQNPDSGELDFAGLSSVNWLAVAIVTACAALVAAILVLVAKYGKKKESK